MWGRFRRGIEAADANLAANMLDYDAVLVTLTGDVALTYVTIRTLEQRLAYVRENVKLQEKGLELTETRFKFGVQTQTSRARNTLSLLLAMPPSDLQEFLGEMGTIPGAPTQAAIGIPADLIRRRPDVRAAEMVVAAQSAAIGVATADLYPQFVLAGSIGLTGESFSDQFESGSGSGFFRRWSTGTFSTTDASGITRACRMPGSSNW